MSFDLTLDVGATTFAALAVLIALLAEHREYRRRRTAELTASVVAEQRLGSPFGLLGPAPKGGPRTITTYWLVVENTGAATALDVDLAATTPQGGEDLLIDVDDLVGQEDAGVFLEVETEELPLKRLGPGARYSFRWGTSGLGWNPTGERAEVTLIWRDANPPWWRFRRGARHETTLPVKLGP